MRAFARLADLVGGRVAGAPDVRRAALAPATAAPARQDPQGSD